MPEEDPSPQRKHVDLLRTLPEGELRNQLSNFAADRINLDRLDRDKLTKIILELQKTALSKLDPNFDPNEDTESNFYDYWDDWNLNNWGDFFDHDFDNT